MAYYDNRLNGKYQVIMEFPQTLKELLWRVAYFRRNQSTWTLLTKSFKPSTTNYTTDVQIKNRTMNVLEKLKAFYESASILHPIPFGSNAGPKFYLQPVSNWPAVDTPVSANSSIKHPIYTVLGNPDIDQSISTGIQTKIDSTQTAAMKNALRMQAGDPFHHVSNPTTANPDGVSAAENLSQDIQMITETAKMILTSYGAPYTTERGEDCTRWLFNSRNTAMKAIALIVQECPWLIQAINKFDFFNSEIVDIISDLIPDGQIYGHFESPDNAAVDSPRHLLKPLWDTKANINSLNLTALAVQGTFQIKYISDSGIASEHPQDLLAIYCNDTYETNSFATNKTI